MFRVLLLIPLSSSQFAYMLSWCRRGINWTYVQEEKIPWAMLEWQVAR